MPLSAAQMERVREIAAREQIDESELARATEMAMGGQSKTETPEPAKGHNERYKLFMYLLPFVRVREVRSLWMGLDESFPGDDENAAEFAAKFAGSGGSDETTDQ